MSSPDSAATPAAAKPRKTVTIYVNTRPHEVDKGDLTYVGIITLAFGSHNTSPNVTYTVKYRRSHGNKQGSLVEGQDVKAKDGMVFDVTCTDKS